MYLDQPTFVTPAGVGGVILGAMAFSVASAGGYRGWTVDANNQVPWWADYRVAAAVIGLVGLSFLPVSEDIQRIGQGLGVAALVSFLVNTASFSAESGQLADIPVVNMLLPQAA